MNNNIHSYTHTMDEKLIFLLIINRDTSDNLCWHLVKIERPTPPPGPPPLQSSISMASSQDNGVIADFTTLGESHFVWPSPVLLQTL